MAQEIEAKFRLDDVQRIRQALLRQGAEYRQTVMETNRYFDWPDGTLRQGDRGLRIRVAQPLDQEGKPAKDTSPKITITYKGARQPSQVKVRQEIEFRLDDADAAGEMFQALGLANTLTFQKRRETWELDGCTVELDELPKIGRFLEIEGPSETCIGQVRAKLGLADTPVEHTPYLGLLCDYLRTHQLDSRDITF